MGTYRFFYLIVLSGFYPSFNSAVAEMLKPTFKLQGRSSRTTVKQSVKFSEGHKLKVFHPEDEPSAITKPSIETRKINRTRNKKVDQVALEKRKAAAKVENNKKINKNDEQYTINNFMNFEPDYKKDHDAKTLENTERNTTKYELKKKVEEVNQREGYNNSASGH